MERELWRELARALKRLPPTRPRNAVYTDAEVLAVLLWAALHDRPISWACRRCNWPVQAWRRRLPDQSTMSRRLRMPRTAAAILALLCLLQRGREHGELLVVDGKPFELSRHTRDRDARRGRGAGGYANGYKLHLIADPAAEYFVAWDVQPLNAAEPTTAAEIVTRRGSLPAGSLLLGDSGYDSNPLHAVVIGHGGQLVAPRKRPGTALGNRPHHAARVESVRMTEGADAWFWREVLGPARGAIERLFGAIASLGCGLATLPTWVRRIHRVRPWIDAKICIYAARVSLRMRNAA